MDNVETRNNLVYPNTRLGNDILRLYVCVYVILYMTTEIDVEMQAAHNKSIRHTAHFKPVCTRQAKSNIVIVLCHQFTKQITNKYWLHAFYKTAQFGFHSGRKNEIYIFPFW